jgi:hypothetical protein
VSLPPAMTLETARAPYANLRTLAPKSMSLSLHYLLVKLPPKWTAN